MKKTILIPVLATILLAGGFVYSATYKNVTPVQKVTVEKEVDGKMALVEEEVDVEDANKRIEKTWSEERTNTFSPAERLRNLENIENNINEQINQYNNYVDELTEAKEALELDITIPKKLTNI